MDRSFEPPRHLGYIVARDVMLATGTLIAIAVATWAISSTVSNYSHLLHEHPDIFTLYVADPITKVFECGLQSLTNPVPVTCSIFNFWWHHIDQRYGIINGEAPWAPINILVAVFLVAGLEFLKDINEYLLTTRGPWMHDIGHGSLALILVQEHINVLRWSDPITAAASRCLPAAAIINESGHRLYMDGGTEGGRPFRFVIRNDWLEEVPKDEVSPEEEGALAVLDSIDYEAVPYVIDAIRIDNDYFERVASECSYRTALHPLLNRLELSVVLFVVLARFLFLNFLAFVFWTSSEYLVNRISPALFLVDAWSSNMSQLSWDYRALVVHKCLNHFVMTLVLYAALVSKLSRFHRVPFGWWEDMDTKIFMTERIWAAGLAPHQHRHIFRNWSGWTHFVLRWIVYSIFIIEAIVGSMY